MTDFRLTIDGNLAARIVVDSDFKVEIFSGDSQLTAAITEQLTSEIGVQLSGGIDGETIIDGAVKMLVPVDDPAALQIALLDLPVALGSIYPNDEDLEIDGDWSVFVPEAVT